MEYSDLIQKSIIRDMAEGVMTIGLDGRISYVNPAASQILDIPVETLTGESFAAVFFEYEENEAFSQLVLDAIYDPELRHESIVPYYTGQHTLQLRVSTSFLRKEGKNVGIIVVLSDISELAELRDAVRAMERIRALNGQLEMRNKLLNETFGRFLSDEIVRQLLDAPDGLMLGGKKRCVTVLMSDLRGFTAMSERMSPQPLLAMLNHYLGEMTEIIQKRGGTIIEFIGDGILAIFGAPAECADHAASAVAAAVEMEARMIDINVWNREQGYPQLRMGIGVNTGEVIVGNIGSEKRTKYGVVGSHVNLAGRIESYTVGGQVLISPNTREQISAELTVAQEQIIFPKGVSTPITISHVMGIGAPYSVSCPDLDIEPLPLPAPAEVSFLPIRGKHVDSVSRYGSFTALSSTSGDLRTAYPLRAFENLQLDIGAKLFAKVMEEKDGLYRLRFTSLPAEFDDWLEKCKGNMNT